jgi:hypothetical protein
VLEELKTIIAIEGVTSKDGLEARKQALNHWIGKYVEEITVENSILKKRLSASDQDFIKLHLAYQIAEKILEEHALVKTEKSKIKVKLLVLKKDFPKNKE